METLLEYVPVVLDQLLLDSQEGDNNNTNNCLCQSELTVFTSGITEFIRMEL